MNSAEIALYLLAGLAGGAVNALAGGAKLFVFPLLLASGLPPVMANATATVALWPAQLPAAWVYRRHLRAGRRGMALRLAPAVAGALAGAGALTLSSDRGFLAVVPVFLTLAVIAIALGERLPRLVARTVPGHRHGALAAVLMAAVGFYGGYFGAGMGFMLVAVLTLAGAGGIHAANAEKNLAAFCINTTAVVPLLASGLVSVPAAAVVAAGGLAGGWAGAHLARRVPARPMRLGVAAMGLALTVSFLLR